MHGHDQKYNKFLKFKQLTTGVCVCVLCVWDVTCTKCNDQSYRKQNVKPVHWQSGLKAQTKGKRAVTG